MTSARRSGRWSSRAGRSWSARRPGWSSSRQSWPCPARRGWSCFFFFQAEDGIRALYVTGVQTCALPIYFRPTSCYVEVEFSEPAPGFWGIEFPEHSELVPANARQQEAAELVQASRTIAGKPSESAPVPSAPEVEALKEEVEKLRKQLESLQTKTAAGNSSAPATTTPPRAA